MEWVSQLAPLAQLTASGALVLILVLLFRAVSAGDWVPKRELDYSREDSKARLAEKDAEIVYLRDAHATSERARELLNQQNRELVSSFRTFEHFFDSLRELARKGGGDVPAQ